MAGLMLLLFPYPMISSAQTFDEMVYSAAQTVFHLNAPTSSDAASKADVDATTGASQQQKAVAKPSVKLRLYAAGQDGKATKTIKMKQVGTDRWEATVKGNLKGQFYTFDTGHGETPGVFAKAVGVNGNRGAVIDLRDTDPAGWQSDVRPPLESPADLVIYEMHWRDFSIDASSGLQHKGKFLALTEPKAIGHLKKLGVNAIHILPSFDYASVDETQPNRPQYNWGYDPKNYNVPEGSYSTDANDPVVRIKEFKEMVQALHRAGIRVILDVVYNHTFDIENSNFQRTYPDYYYRKAKDGKYSNGSGCGNETASEKPLMRQFMLESMKYWAEEYHIDGFRVDLMGVHDIETMNKIQKEMAAVDPTIFIYGEGWSAGACAYPTEKLAMKANVNQMPGIAAFSDEMRDALRGPFSDDTKGAFLAGISGHEESIKYGIAGAIAHPQVDMSKVNYSKEPWANEPTQMIAYVSCHDDMCLVDRLRASALKPVDGSEQTAPSESPEQTLVKLDLLAQTAVFTSQGVPFMLSGEEMLRDKKGVHNSFNSPDSINHLDWTNLEKHPEVFGYYSNLISLRKRHAAFRLGTAERVRQHLEFLPSQPCLVAYRLKNLGGIDSWNNIIVILNSNRESRCVDIPEGTYSVVCAGGAINEAGIATVSGTSVEVAPQSALILHQ